MKKLSVKWMIALVLLLLVMTAGAVHLLFGVYLYDDNEYKIRGLKLSQEEFSIHASWKAEDCKGYSVMVFSGMGVPTEYNTTDNEFTVEDIKIGTKYRFLVSAIGEDGTRAGANRKSIETTKVKQEITLENEELLGFKGDGASLGASAHGDLTYSIDKSAVASVSQKGNVYFRKAGKATITVSTAGDDNYRKARKTVSVTVYPGSLPAPKLKAKSKGKTQGTLSWNRIDYATGYVISKLDPATDKYEKFREVEADKTKVTLTRDQAKYKIKAIAKVGGRTVEGKESDVAEIKSYGQEAPSYGSAHNVKTLGSSNLETVAMIQRPGAVDVPQSMCFNGEEYIVTYVNHGGSQGALQAFSRDGEITRSGSISGMGHANGSTYDPHTGLIYTVKTHKNIKSSTCATYKEKDFSDGGKFDLPRTTSGIAYDESNDKFYLSKGNSVYVCDSEFNIEKSIHKKARYNHAQDIGAYNGVALVCTWVNGNTSYIDMYRISDEAYLGSYDVSIGEIESCIVDDGYLVILMNTRGSSRDYIYRTKERIEIP